MIKPRASAGPRPSKTKKLGKTVETLVVSPRRTGRLNVRLSKEEESTVLEAITVLRVTLSEYVRTAVVSRAQTDLADRTAFKLSSKQYAAFLKALDRPVTAKPRLKALLSEPSILDRDA